MWISHKRFLITLLNADKIPIVHKEEKRYELKKDDETGMEKKRERERERQLDWIHMATRPSDRPCRSLNLYAYLFLSLSLSLSLFASRACVLSISFARNTPILIAHKCTYERQERERRGNDFRVKSITRRCVYVHFWERQKVNKKRHRELVCKVGKVHKKKWKWSVRYKKWRERAKK